jgi:hypothetical protein
MRARPSTLDATTADDPNAASPTRKTIYPRIPTSYRRAANNTPMIPTAIISRSNVNRGRVNRISRLSSWRGAAGHRRASRTSEFQSRFHSFPPGTVGTRRDMCASARGSTPIRWNRPSARRTLVSPFSILANGTDGVKQGSGGAAESNRCRSVRLPGRARRTMKVRELRPS